MYFWGLWGMAQVVECLLTKLKALSFILSTANKPKQKTHIFGILQELKLTHFIFCCRLIAKLSRKYRVPL
jgi:hypothetical protein